MSEKLDMMKKGFETWKKLAMVRMGVSIVGVADDKQESLGLLLESAFEAGFSFGAATATRDLMSELVEAQNGQNSKVNGSIMAPGVGHA